VQRKRGPFIHRSNRKTFSCLYNHVCIETTVIVELVEQGVELACVRKNMLWPMKSLDLVI